MAAARPPADATEPPAPPISVVIPTRGRSDLLPRAIRSVLEQDYPGEIECTVVFDQSEPALPDIEVPPRRVLRADRNDRTPGAAGARNAGAERSSHPYLAFLDDDDEWHPDKLRRQLDALRRDGAAIGAVCGMVVRYGSQSRERLPDGPRITHRDMLRSRRIETNFCTLLIRREDFLHRVGPIDETIPASFGEDYDWMLRATSLGHLAAVTAPLITVHWHGGSWFQDRWHTMAIALTELLARHPDFEREPKGRARILGQIAFARAAEGRPQLGRKVAAEALRLNPLEMRAYLTFVVSLGLLSPARVLDVAHRFGKGI